MVGHNSTIDDEITGVITELNNHYRYSDRSSLKPIELPDAISKIVICNGGVLYGCAYAGLGGLFIKDSKRSPLTTIFGRFLCDDVKERWDCNGFFTTDELPRYGISRSEKRHILRFFEASDADLVALYAYDRGTSALINEYVACALSQSFG